MMNKDVYLMHTSLASRPRRRTSTRVDARGLNGPLPLTLVIASNVRLDYHHIFRNHAIITINWIKVAGDSDFDDFVRCSEVNRPPRMISIYSARHCVLTTINCLTCHHVHPCTNLTGGLVHCEIGCKCIYLFIIC